MSVSHYSRLANDSDSSADLSYSLTIDDEFDNNVLEQKTHYASMVALKKSCDATLCEITMRSVTLKRIYNISDDSLEQIELELLKKHQDILDGIINTALTPTEKAHIALIERQGITEYQKLSLSLHSDANAERRKIAVYTANIDNDVRTIQRIVKERIRSNPMDKAAYLSDSLLEASSAEICTMLLFD